jgi:D-alanyl-lipoteichoic acid acyltransferase DltB (MBOAT superfamily)
MAFNSFLFLVFFVLIFFIYWRMKKSQWLLLLVASYVFYASWNLKYLGLIILTTLVNYVAALKIQENRQRKKTILILTLLFNFGLLFIFKYINFFNYSLSYGLLQLNIHLSLPELKLLLPLGISFYTFTIAAYIADVYSGKIKPAKNLGRFALFVALFPKIIAGPIERYQRLELELKTVKKFNYEQVVSGLKLFGLGLFKKLVVADNLAAVINVMFGKLTDFKGLSLVLLMVMYSWQIYADFSGYTDMARGLGRILGINLLENFRVPYAATSVRDFWRRWHISLSNWFRDYLYIPLKGSRKGLIRTCLNTMIVFVVCGLWHGAAWHFVIWGGFHGLIMTMERIAVQINQGRIRLPKLVLMLYTYITLCFSWMLFRADKLTEVKYIWQYALVGIKNFINPSYIAASLNQIFETNKLEVGIMVLVIAAMIGLDLLKIKPKWQVKLQSQPRVVRFAGYTLFLLLIAWLRKAEVHEFIYIRF